MIHTGETPCGKGQESNEWLNSSDGLVIMSFHLLLNATNKRKTRTSTELKNYYILFID